MIYTSFKHKLVATILFLLVLLTINNCLAASNDDQKKQDNKQLMAKAKSLKNEAHYAKYHYDNIIGGYRRVFRGLGPNKIPTNFYYNPDGHPDNDALNLEFEVVAGYQDGNNFLIKHFVEKVKSTNETKKYVNNKKNNLDKQLVDNNELQKSVEKLEDIPYHARYGLNVSIAEDNYKKVFRGLGLNKIPTPFYYNPDEDTDNDALNLEFEVVAGYQNGNNFLIKHFIKKDKGNKKNLKKSTNNL